MNKSVIEKKVAEYFLNEFNVEFNDKNKDFNVLDLFGDTRGIYLISSACDFYKASYGVWIVGLSKSSDQTFIIEIPAQI